MDAESIRKHLKVFNFTTTYAILKKLTTNTFLNKFFHMARSWDVTHKVSDSVNRKPLKMSQKILFWPNFIHFLILQ